MNKFQLKQVELILSSIDDITEGIIKAHLALDVLYESHPEEALAIKKEMILFINKSFNLFKKECCEET